VSPCARCGFELSDSATKCLFCGHVVGAALPPSTSSPVEGAARPATDPGTRIPRPTMPYRRPDDLDVEAASTPPPSPLLRPGFGAEAAASQNEPAAVVDPVPAVDPVEAAGPARGSMVTTLVIAVLVGAIAGGIGFLIFIALRG
jgi:hypothetical protein